MAEGRATALRRQAVSTSPSARGGRDGDEIVVEVAPDVVVEHYEQSRPFRLVFDVYRRRDAGIEGEEAADAEAEDAAAEGGDEAPAESE